LALPGLSARAFQMESDEELCQPDLGALPAPRMRRGALLLLLLLLPAVLPRARALSPFHDLEGKWTVQPRNGFPLGDTLWLADTLKGWQAVVYRLPPQGPDEVAALPGGWRHATVVLLSNAGLELHFGPVQLNGQMAPDRTHLLLTWSEPGQAPRPLMLGRSLVFRDVTPAELEQEITTLRGLPDKKAAAALYRLRLTGRLEPDAFVRCRAMLGGPRALTALLEVRDRSLFLPDPLLRPPPSPAAIEQMIAGTQTYLLTTIHRLPDFSARRTTIAFQRLPSKGEPPEEAAHSVATVRYSNGQEQQRSDKGTEAGMVTGGEFGPILLPALMSIQRRGLSWKRWESYGSRPAAVFEYATGTKNSYYAVDGQRTGYAAEVTIDPETGAVLRIVMEADLEPANPLLTADIMVEYEDVDIGGKTHTCPVHGVAISEGPSSWRLNDITFTDYTLFGSSMRMLPDYRPVR